jgi:hypothetical protein
MIPISFSIALIAIVFGAKLLAQSQKENLGALYKYLAWFIIAAGFCVLMCDGIHGIMRCCNMHRNNEMRREMMMNRGDGMGMRGGPMGMRHFCDGNMGNNCCDGMMNCGSNNNCSGMMNCPDGKGAMNSGCPMMGNGMKCTTDSGKSGK